MFKKTGLIFGVFLSLFIILLATAPVFLESKIDVIAERYIDKNIKAKVRFSDLDLSLITSFPLASVDLKGLVITGLAPFENDTLLVSEHLYVKVPLLDVLKRDKEDLIKIQEINIDGLLLNLKINKDGLANYDITKEEGDDSDSPKIGFNIEDYELKNSEIIYIDEESEVLFQASILNHSGKGTYTGDIIDLSTNTDVLIKSGESIYLNNLHIKLDADFNIDLVNNKYTLKDNKGYLNALPIVLDGYIALIEDGQEIDLVFENPEASFKDFLGLIPEGYAKSIDGVTTNGNFTLKGIVKGKLTEKTIPTIDISMLSKNASFKYPDLPKSVQNININATVKNTTGKTEDTFVDIEQLDFTIDKDGFKSEMHFSNLTENIVVNAKMNGVLNLANLSNAYPFEMEQGISGVFKIALNTYFDMTSLENKNYKKIKSSGIIGVSNLVYKNEDFNHPFYVSNAAMSFKPGQVVVKNLQAKIGGTDMLVKGTVKDFLPFLFDDQNFKGDFTLSSDLFLVADFLGDGELVKNDNGKGGSTNAETGIKVPAFIDCTFKGKAKEVVYDNLNLKNLSGSLKVKNQTVEIQDLKTDLFGGSLALKGSVSTQNQKTPFNMRLGINQFNITESFSKMEILTAFAPISNVIKGKFNSIVNLTGFLNNGYSPDLTTLKGDLSGQIVADEILPENSPLLSLLIKELKFIDTNKINLDRLKVKMSIDNGKVNVRPISLNYEDIGIKIGGSHSLTNNMDYNAVFDVPAKYLGDQLAGALQDLSPADTNEINVPVKVSMKGSFTKPIINTDLKSGVTSLTNQLIARQKQKAIAKGKDKATEFIGNAIFGKTKVSTDTTATAAEKSENEMKKEVINKGVNVIKGLFGK